MLDKIIFGDNQFFGINHKSDEKAQALSEKFRDLNAITDVIEMAYEEGIRAFMINTHIRAKDICEYFCKHSSRFSELHLYPSMPYAHKYANAVTEKGLFGALNYMLLKKTGVAGLMGILSKSGRIVFEKDMLKVMQLLIDLEMKIFKDLDVKVIFLQNIVTDLLLGFGVKAVFIEFVNYIRKKYNTEPGFVTLNMPRLVDFLLDCGIENPTICSAINKAGYFMNPDIKSYENTLQRKQFRPMAMSILASGAVQPEDAVEYVARQPGIQSIVFGASSQQHIRQTKELIDCYF
ncbi:MAG: hypothetical protein P8X68_23350 [Desulfobacterales bacterium]